MTLQTGRAARTIARWVLAALYVVAGVAHLAMPEPFVKITPGWVPMPETVVFWTGIAELFGAAALAQGWSPTLRRAGATGLALYALCVWPANVNHMIMDLARPDHGVGLAYHLPRMVLQPVLIWLALWSGGVIDWPRRTTRKP
ncbi:DoxX family protein [Croceicoccus bisphenolivorans]|uniref:DoxX family protein n=1 Tax=Croceicoccus bisphenolivorans TaxID=1783232 RepID=UPI000837859E|nr:DoxX family protein [Croceicoccus bisphenolivorans]